MVHCLIPVSSLPIGRLDFAIKSKSFPSRRLLRQSKQVEVLGGQKLEIAVKNVIDCGSGYFGRWNFALRFRGVKSWMECWLDQWHVRNASFQDTPATRIHWSWVLDPVYWVSSPASLVLGHHFETMPLYGITNHEVLTMLCQNVVPQSKMKSWN